MRLLAALRAQDPAVAAPLLGRFGPMISRLLWWTLGPRARTDCAVEVVLLCAFHRAHRLRTRSNLRQFILRATARLVQTELGQRARPSSRSRRGWRAARPTAPRGATLRKHQAVKHLYRIFDRLNAADRIAFVFHYVEEVEVRDVAAALGITTLVTRCRLERVLRTVHDGLGRDPLLPKLRKRF